MAAIQQVLMAVGTSILLPSDLFANASAESFNDENASCIVFLNFNVDGTLVLEYNANGTLQDPPFPVTENYTWRVGGSSSLYSVRMRRISGSAFSFGSAAVDTWIPITTDLNWNLISSTTRSQPFNSKVFLGVLEIAYSNNLTNILAQSNINFSTSASTQGGFIP